MKLNIRPFILLSACVAVGLLAVLCTTYLTALKNPVFLPRNDAEQPMTLKGKLVLKIFPGPPEYSSIEEGDRADDCWILQLDQSSSEVLAGKLPDLELAYDLKDIREGSRLNEVLLVLDEHTEHFCQSHRNETIVSEGCLFPAHTAHHYTSLLMDVKRCWSERE